MPAVKLFFENLAADLSQKLKSLLFAIAFRQQVDCRLSSEIVECEVRTGRIHSVKPVQERLPRPNYYRRSVNQVHGVKVQTVIV